MKLISRVLFIAALIVLGVWLWKVFFPSPERVIRRKFVELGKVASFGKEGPLAIAGNVSKLVVFFSRDVQIKFESMGEGEFTLNGRDELQQAALAARQTLGSAQVDFIDVNVLLGADKESATVHLTVKARLRGESELNVQEMKFWLKKIEREWLIVRAETVKTLSGVTHGRNEISSMLVRAPCRAMEEKLSLSRGERFLRTSSRIGPTTNARPTLFLSEREMVRVRENRPQWVSFDRTIVSEHSHFQRGNCATFLG